MAENTFGVVSSTFVEAIHVELPDKGVHFAMTEVFGEDQLLKLISILDDELGAIGSPINDLGKLFILGKNKTTLRISKVFEMKPATSAT